MLDYLHVNRYISHSDYDNSQGIAWDQSMGEQAASLLTLRGKSVSIFCRVIFFLSELVCERQRTRDGRREREGGRDVDEGREGKLRNERLFSKGREREASGCLLTSGRVHITNSAINRPP